MCQAIKSFFHNGKLPKQINHMFIALIQKILVNRMRPILDKIIDPVQSAFVPKRSIHDNILFTHEIMNKFSNMRGKKSWVALKLDMKKAYDRVGRTFLFEALRQLGFHPQWICWVKECVTTVFHYC